jgi:hypothetical protein
MAGLLTITLLVDEPDDALAAVRAVYGWGVTECGGCFYLDGDDTWFTPVGVAVFQPSQTTKDDE